MEPPAVTSCSINNHSGGIVGGQHVSHGHNSRRDNMPGFLQIEPQLNFNPGGRHFEDLPENFLETISPQQAGGNNSGGVHGHSHAGQHSSISMAGAHLDSGSHSTATPQLASLTTMSVTAGPGADNRIRISYPERNFGGYANLVPMPSSSHYISSLKMEAMDHLNHASSQLHQNTLDKTRNFNFGNGPAGLLSPLQLDGAGRDQNAMGGLLGGIHRSNGGGRPSDMLSGIRRNNVSYIKEEMSADMSYQGAHDYDGYALQQPTPQELERMANAETPPALSNVEITSSILASLSRESPSPSIQHSPQHFIIHHQQMQQQQQQVGNLGGRIGGTGSSNRSNKVKLDPDPSANRNKEIHYPSTSHDLSALDSLAHASYMVGGPMGPGAGIPRATYSTTDTTDPLNAEIDDEIYIDTKDLCKRVAYELKQHSIPQAIFAERILCRSQGTLSDLLRNPKPWNRLKSGRETFRRMFNWLQQPLHIRLSILDMYKGPIGGSTSAAGIIPPTPAQNSRHHHRNRRSSGEEDANNPPQKRPRLVFTDIQKRTLQAIFKETQRPSREMQQTIAEHLRLDMSTVSNFFMNARRRSRNGNGIGDDEPAPYQQIQTITPPPDSPPSSANHHGHSQRSSQQLLSDAASIVQVGGHSSGGGQRSRSNNNKQYHPQHDQQGSSSALNHFDETLAEVVGKSVAYLNQQRRSNMSHSMTSPLADMDQDWLDEPEDEDETAVLDMVGGDNLAIHIQNEMLSTTMRNIPMSNKVITVKVEHEISSGNNGDQKTETAANKPPTSVEDVEQLHPGNVEGGSRTTFEDTMGHQEHVTNPDEQRDGSNNGVGHDDALSPYDDANAPTAPGTPLAAADLLSSPSTTMMDESGPVRCGPATPPPPRTPAPPKTPPPRTPPPRKVSSQEDGEPPAKDDQPSHQEEC